jgi:hypothetical protein
VPTPERSQRDGRAADRARGRHHPVDADIARLVRCPQPRAGHPDARDHQLVDDGVGVSRRG